MSLIETNNTYILITAYSILKYIYACKFFVSCVSNNLLSYVNSKFLFFFSQDSVKVKGLLAADASE